MVVVATLKTLRTPDWNPHAKACSDGWYAIAVGQSCGAVKSYSCQQTHAHITNGHSDDMQNKNMCIPQPPYLHKRLVHVYHCSQCLLQLSFFTICLQNVQTNYNSFNHCKPFSKRLYNNFQTLADDTSTCREKLWCYILPQTSPNAGHIIKILSLAD